MSDTAKYTKGPWRIDLHGDHYKMFAVEAQDFSGTWRWVVDRVRGGNKQQTQANAKLIACAPELAEMLLSMLVHVSHSGPTHEDVKALLKKAGVL